MRTIVFIVALAAVGCDGSSTCKVDGDCPGQVCGADGECYANTQVRSITLMWTVQTATPTAANCAAFDDLGAQFSQQACDTAEDETAGPLIDTTVTCTDSTAIVANVPTTYLYAAMGQGPDDFCQDQSIPGNNTLSFDIE